MIVIKNGKSFEMCLSFKIFLFVLWIENSLQHGYLADPPQRSSVWRENPNAPVDYNDNQLYCGGRENLILNHGRCGTCGDPYQGPREHEAGGKYARGIIVRSYPANKRKLPVKVVLTAFHKGYYEFKICPHDNTNVPVSQRCLDRYPLKIIEGSRRRKTRYYPTRSGAHYMNLILPRGFRCSQCVLQWRYRTGNSWGVDRKRRRGCVGCGYQEEFWNCADIKIGHSTRRIKSGTDSDSNSEESDSGGSDNTVKESGIKILNQFFSPFESKTSGNFGILNRRKNQIPGVQNLFLDSAPTNKRRHIFDDANNNALTVLKSKRAMFDSGESSEDNNFETRSSKILQNSRNRNPIRTNTNSLEVNEILKRKQRPVPIFSKIRHSPALPWMSLINGNHGNIQTSFIPRNEWRFL